MRAKDGNRVVYSVPGASQSERTSVLKLVSEDEDHGREMEAYLRLPLLCAKVFWQGRVGVKWPNDLDRGITTMNALVQSQCTLAIKWLKPRRGKDIANQFLCLLYGGDAVCAAVRFCAV